jgi:hypothetical protein
MDSMRILLMGLAHSRAGCVEEGNQGKPNGSNSITAAKR